MIHIDIQVSRSKVKVKGHVGLPHLVQQLRGSVKNNWELSNISKTMKRNLLKFSMIIEQSYLHNRSKKSTPQRDVTQCDVILVTSY